MGARTLNELKLRHETRSQLVKVLKVFAVTILIIVSAKNKKLENDPFCE